MSKGGILGEKDALNFRTPATTCVTHTTVLSSTRVGALGLAGRRARERHEQTGRRDDCERDPLGRCR